MKRITILALALGIFTAGAAQAQQPSQVFCAARSDIVAGVAGTSNMNQENKSARQTFGEKRKYVWFPGMPGAIGEVYVNEDTGTFTILHTDMRDPDNIKSCITAAGTRMITEKDFTKRIKKMQENGSTFDLPAYVGEPKVPGQRS